QEPRATVRSAYTWMAIGALVGGLSSGLVTLLAGLTLSGPFDAGLLVAIPLYALLVVLFWAIFAGSAQLMAQLFKGRGTHQQLSYVFAAFSAPLTIIFSLLSLVPQTGVPQILLYLYWVVLYILAIRAVNQFSFIRALGSGLIALLVTILVGGIGYGLLLMPGIW
ncbi:MAG TPA: YIP1 family protein, partial [Roseiflexaceae bacterium]|nr:YIP1 family protein [Roseiflexaceae bacterium]